MKKFILITLVLCIVIAITSMAQKETPPIGGEPKDFSLPEKLTGTLENGLNYVLVPYGAIPKVTVRLVVKTGNIHEEKEEIWLSDLTGNLIKEGSADLNQKDLANKMASMGGDLSVSVSPHATYVGGSVLSEYCPQLVTLLGNVLMHPAFPESELSRLKNDLKRQLSFSKTVPQSLAAEKFNSIIYPNHPYGNLFPTEEMLEGYSIKDVKEFYTNNFGALRTTIYIVGKFDSKTVEKAILETFNEWDKGPESFYPKADPFIISEIALIDRKEAPQTTIIMGLPVIGPDNPDYLALLITNSLLGGSFGSRITSNIREDKGYTYSPNSSINPGYKVGVWAQEADVSTDVTGASLREISKEIYRLRREPPSSEELEGIQNYSAGVFVLQNSSPAGIINQLAFLNIYELDESYLTDRVKNIYKITPEDVQKMTEKYIDPEKMFIVLVGDEESLIEQVEEFQQSLKQY